MIMGCHMLVCVLLRPVGSDVHFLHDLRTALDADILVIISPQIGMECFLPRHIAAVMDHLAEQLHDSFVFRFLCGHFSVLIFLPGFP